MVVAALEVASIGHLAEEIGAAEHAADGDRRVVVAGEQRTGSGGNAGRHDQRSELRMRGEGGRAQVVGGERGASRLVRGGELRSVQRRFGRGAQEARIVQQRQQDGDQSEVRRQRGGRRATLPAGSRRRAAPSRARRRASAAGRGTACRRRDSPGDRPRTAARRTRSSSAAARGRTARHRSCARECRRWRRRPPPRRRAARCRSRRSTRVLRTWVQPPRPPAGPVAEGRMIVGRFHDHRAGPRRRPGAGPCVGTAPRAVERRACARTARPWYLRHTAGLGRRGRGVDRRPESARDPPWIRHAYFDENTQQTPAAARGRADRRRRASIDERQGGDGVRRALRRRDALREGLQGSGTAQLPTGRRLHGRCSRTLIDGVVRQLTSGKEAMVFVVRCGDETRCAKVYKEADRRSFRQAVDYTENRRTKNTRQARAMAKGTRFGRQARESAWQSAEVDALYRLAAAGVRVPKPYQFHEGVLLMELVTDEHGAAAPRLVDLRLHAGSRARPPPAPDPRSRTDALRRRRARRPERVQHPDRQRRAGDHRPPAGGGCRREQPRARRSSSVTSPTCATASAGTRRSCWSPTTVARSGRCSKPVPCSTTRR